MCGEGKEEVRGVLRAVHGSSRGATGSLEPWRVERSSVLQGNSMD